MEQHRDRKSIMVAFSQVPRFDIRTRSSVRKRRRLPTLEPCSTQDGRTAARTVEHSPTSDLTRQSHVPCVDFTKQVGRMLPRQDTSPSSCNAKTASSPQISTKARYQLIDVHTRVPRMNAGHGSIIRKSVGSPTKRAGGVPRISLRRVTPCAQSKSQAIL